MSFESNQEDVGVGGTGDENIGVITGDEREEMLSKYYGNDVLALMALKIDTSRTEAIATRLSRMDAVLEVYLVTGDIDLLAKTRFPDYAGMRDFILNDLSGIDGVKETKTMVVVRVFKE